MNLSISRLHHPVLSLGVGRRAGIWFQGCSIACSGCVSQDTWQSGSEHRTTVDAVLQWCSDVFADGAIDGVTISGGEPLDQPESLLELLVGIRDLATEQSRAFDVLCYTGYPISVVRRFHGSVLPYIDAMVTGPYRSDLPTDLIWRGSSNQRLVTFSSLGIERYQPYADLRPSDPPMQVSLRDGAIYWIGIPRPEGMGPVVEGLRSRGIEVDEVSWIGSS